MENASLEKIADFCKICDNFKNDKDAGCKVLRPWNQIFYVINKGLCEEAVVNGNKTEISYDNERKYSRFS